MNVALVIERLVRDLEHRLGDKAVVKTAPPEGGWGTVRLVVEPIRPARARVVVWDDNGTLAIAAGRSARFDVDLDEPNDAATRAVEIVCAIAGGQIVERFLGRITLNPRLEPSRGSRLRLTRQLGWPPY